ncbi:hypothetical protein SLS62_010151 [Diatrype stigma]|uniref:Zn(2)-C6 fungal-type domain-containing protein n=1 Tax=Diatrype stigma TaxID=117547 RepID=A0AAN9UAU8_9PEZI
MEFFESQVGEVRHLMGAAGAGAPSIAPQRGSAPVGNNSAHDHNLGRLPTSSASPAVTTDSSKRKHSIEASSPGSKAQQQRTKRNRYISIACNECKRRKIKCNGETPCQRCGNLNLQCLYAPNCCSNNFKDSDEFKEMASQVSHLQEQVENLFSSMHALRSDSLRLAPIQERIPGTMPALTSAASTPSSTSVPPSMSSLHHRPSMSQLRQTNSFRGPTSAHFSLDVAKNTLHKMGYSNLGDTAEDDSAIQDTPVQSPVLLTDSSQYGTLKDPLWDFDKEEMIRLCRLHEEEVGIMYPVIRIESIISHAISLSSWLDTMKKNGLIPPLGQDGNMTDLNTLLLKVVLSVALVVEEHGYSEKAHKLFETIRPTADRMLMSDPSDIKVVPFLALVAGYRFLASDEILAWRTMGQVARLCIELGLHRRDAVSRIESQEARDNAIHTFWTAYVLDRRWAFSTGLPWVIQDDDINVHLPYPDAHPFLAAMITYSKCSATVWKVVRQLDPDEEVVFHPGDFENLDSQIKQWYSAVPKEMQLKLPDWESVPRLLNPPVNSQKEYDIQRLQIWTYLRLNQIRILLFTPVLHTHSSIMENMHFAERVVKLAKNTIRYLTHLNNTTNIYRKIQAFYHQFLTSAIAVLFLASCHAPVNFSSSCRDEFYMALDLVKGMSSRSFVSKRLWMTIKSLREVAPRLGLAEDPHSTAALTMAGLATGQMGPTSQGGSGPPSHSPVTPSGFPRPPLPNASIPHETIDLNNGHQISSEMSRIFEGYIGMNGYSPPPDPAVTAAAAAANIHSMDDGAVGLYATGGSVYHHFKDLF